jgi:hypothetical protein
LATCQWVEKWNKLWEYSYLGNSYTDWIRFCSEFKTTEYAKKAAKARGMQFWGIWAFYDYGGKASTRAAEGMGPWESYDPWLIAHPEYCLWDRAGITFNTSVIEYGYPEVRKEYVRRLEEMFKDPWNGYDGIFMYTYIEHSSVRYNDEYIYSGVACDEYKKRYGVDPRTETLDLDKYYAIRGEYVTQYLRDIRPVFKKYGKKFAIVLNPNNMELPQEWTCGTTDILQQGRTKMDWRTWVREGLVDELHVWGGASLQKQHEDIKMLLDAVKGTDIQVTVSCSEFPASMQYLYDKGVRRVTYADDKNEDGYEENCPASDLTSKDTLAVMSVLRQVREGTLDIPSSKITPLLHHNNPMVRRQAARVIGVQKMQDAVPALEQATRTEKECGVVTMMIDALGEVNSSKSLAAIATAFDNQPLWPVRRATIVAVGRMGKGRHPDILKAFNNSKNAYFRAVLLESVYDTEQPDKRAFYMMIPEFYEMLQKGANDPDEQVRLRAAYSLTVYPRMETAEILLKMLDDSSDAVQSRAARSINCMLQNAIYISLAMQQRLLDKLMARYHQFGPECKRKDAQWGWWLFGDAIRQGFGVKGKNALIDILNGSDIELAKRTWQVLFLNEDYRWMPMPREEMEANYRYYPGRPDHIACPHVAVN